MDLIAIVITILAFILISSLPQLQPQKAQPAQLQKRRRQKSPGQRNSKQRPDLSPLGKQMLLFYAVSQPCRTFFKNPT